MRMTGRPLAFVGAAITSLLPLGAAAQTAAPRSAIPTFHYDLRNRTSDDLLPFDIRFNVRAKVDETVSDGTLQYLRGDCPEETDDGKKDLESVADTGDGRKVRGRSHRAKTAGAARVAPAGRGVEKSAIFKSTAVGTGDNRELLFSVSPPLQPNHDYCFVFTLDRTLTEAEATEFQSAVTKTIDQATANVKGNDQGFRLSQQELKDLRKAIAENVGAATMESGAKPVPSKDSAFNVDLPDTSALEAKFNAQLAEILQQQLNRRNSAKGFCRERKQANTLVGTAFDPSSPVLKLLKTVKGAETDTNVHKAIGMSADSLDRLIKGEFDTLLNDDKCKQNSEGIPEIAAMRDQQSLGAVRTQFTDLRDDFANVEKSLDTIGGDQKALKKLKTDTKRVIDAKQDVRDIREQLDVVVSRLDNFNKALGDRVAAVIAMASSARAEVRTTVPLVSSTTADFTTRNGYYVTMDVGLATAPWDVKQTFTYAGMNIYTRPINKQAPLLLHDSEWLRKRLSFTLGLTLQNVQQQNAFGGLIGDRGVVTGVGLRILDSIKLTGGALWIKESDPNPLVSRSRIAATPFLALSIDWDVRSTFSSLGAVLNVPQ